MTNLPFRPDAALESLTDAFQAFDREWRYLYLNRRAEQLLGRTRGELLGRVLWDVSPEFVETGDHARYIEAMETGRPVVFESFHPHDGTWTELSLHPHPGGLGAFLRDITERKRAEEALHAARRETVEILESIADAFYAVDHAWRFTYVNRRAEEIWGIRRERLIGRNLWEAFPASVGGRIEEELRRAALQRQRADFDLFSPVMRRWLGVTVNPTDAGLSVYFRDITRQKQAEEEQWAFLRDVLASVTDGKLRLCRGPADLPARLPERGKPVPLTRESLIRARRGAAQAAEAAGLDQVRTHDLVTAVGEAAMNAVVHAGGGTVTVGASPAPGMVQVWIEDQGAGIEISRLPEATLRIGYTTRGTLGHGVKLILQTVDRMWLLTGAHGTTVVLEQETTAPTPGWMGRTEP
jgi:PAS domain S-box-containing protein